MGYMTNFIVYMLAMVGVIMLALFVFKNATGCKSKTSSGNFLKIIDSISLTPRKNLYVVAAGNEKFLIAGDSERTTMISKLSSDMISAIHDEGKDEDDLNNNFKNIIPKIPRKESYIDRTIAGIGASRHSSYESVMKSLAEKMRT